MNHKDVLTTAASILNDRNAQYGAMELCMDRAAKIASIITAKWITAYDIALILHSVKLARLENNRSNPENYVDGINYLAFGAQLSDASLGGDIEEDIAAMARRFAPRREQTYAETNNGSNGGVTDNGRPDAPAGG
jgi:Domain of unknown function (DUF6378)